MFGIFKRAPKPMAELPDLPPPRPEQLTYAVGDLHGRLDLLELMIDRIERDRAGAHADLVFLGDYVDRGPESAAVLRRLATLALPQVRVTCLMGNHDRMLLDFLDDPDRSADRWLRNGGTETLASFALGRADPDAGGSRLVALRDLLRSAMGDALEAWLRALPLRYLSGTLGCVHAITQTDLDWDAQRPETLLWGRPTDALGPRGDGIWVTHGHTIVEEPTIARGHIALDTGAYRSGILSGLRCASDGEMTVFSVQVPDQ